MSEIHDLPPEIVMKIFHMLSKKDLSKVVLVCNKWKELVEEDHKSPWVRLYVNLDYIDIDMLGVRRLQHVRAVKVRDDWPWGSERILKKLLIVKLLKLHKLCQLELELELSRLSYVDSRLLATLVNKLEYVDMDNCWLPRQKVNILFGQMSEGTMLKTLWINTSDLSGVDPETLATCINQLEAVSLYACKLTNQQVIKVMARMSETTNLETLKVKNNDLSTVDPDTLARAVNNVKDVDLIDTKMTVQQVNCLLNQAARQTKLTSLVLNEYHVRHVNKHTLKQAKENIGDLNICDYIGVFRALDMTL
jgi:hypothetical protein